MNNDNDNEKEDTLIISVGSDHIESSESLDSITSINIDDFLKNINGLDLSGLNNNMSSFNYPNTTIGVTNGGTNGSILTGNSANNWYTPYTISAPKSGLTVSGDAEFEGDIKWKGRSLGEMLSKIEQRLSILVPDPEKLEHFEALRKAYEHYKTLEALCDLPPKEDE